MEKILANTVYSDSTLKSWNKGNLIELIRILENNWANAENSLNIQAKNCEMLLHQKEEALNDLKKDYIELDLECRNLRTELDKELAEHEEFTKKANSLIELQKENIEKTHKNNMELREEIESLKSKSSYKNSWKNKFFKAQEEVERLNQGYDMLNYESARKEEYIETLKKQVDDLKEERENMSDEIFSLEQQKEDLYFQNKNLQTYIDNHEPIWKRNAEQYVKDTAKEIFEKIFFYRNRKDTTNFDNMLLNMAKEYGVEVE